MVNAKIDMLALEQSLTGANQIDIIAMEQNNADENYAALNKELNSEKSNLKNPDVGQYDCGIDYEDISSLKSQKDENIDTLKKIKEIEQYYNDGQLYIGHMNTKYYDYYFMDNILPTRELKVEDKKIRLINTDDVRYQEHLHSWHYPEKDKDVNFSYNIDMKNRQINDVDVIIDRANDENSKITDAYLRKALIRNKSIPGIHSIIQTIQMKQNNIRSLPVNNSFIVQGCAGSGKTMVLLHRLRYLLYNKEIYNDEYLYLTPGTEYKSFIDEISKEFKINARNILTFYEYYLYLLNVNNRANNKENSELVFTNNFLSRVYSERFIKECYHELYGLLIEQTNGLINICEDTLNNIIDTEKKDIEESITQIKNQALESVENAIGKIKTQVSVCVKEYDDISLLVDEVSSTYYNRKNEYTEATRTNNGFEISPDDERIKNNSRLNHIKEEIQTEQNIYEKASIFTKTSHKHKLDKLKENYQNEYSKFIDELKEADKKRLNDLEYVYDSVKLSDVEEILGKLIIIDESSKKLIFYEKNRIDNLTELLGKKYQKEINYLNYLIALSTELDTEHVGFIDNLSPCFDFFCQKTRRSIKLFERIKKIANPTDENNFGQNLKLFHQRTDKQFSAYLNVLLFNICKKKIKEEFGLAICEKYKHFWYLRLYCSYLTQNAKFPKRKYLFVDEAQDLSVSEISLIQKINNAQDNKVVLNLFGDTNQMISKHGVTSWSDISSITSKYVLNENFRNTNQIVDYCNKNLSLNMKKIGVSMDEVCEYNSLEDVLYESIRLSNTVFIVKDEYAKKDLVSLTNRNNIKDYLAFTVKEVKGLEFSEVYVFDYNMTRNEKYISYTRALAKLNVIHSLPELYDRTTPLIIQGDEDELQEENQ